MVPILAAVYLAFTSYTVFDPRLSFVGLRNFRLLFEDPFLVGVLLTTVLFSLAAVLIAAVVGLGIALLLARQMKGMSAMRAIYLIPLMVPGIAASVSWRALLDPNAGWMNYFLTGLNIPAQDWLGDENLALVSVVLADVWIGIPVVAVLTLAGLLALPEEPVEAARVDGASSWQIFRYITLPALRPILGFVVIFRLVEVMRQFAVIQVLTGGGPGQKTTVLNYYVYQTTFTYGNLSYGSTLAVLLLVLMVIPMVIIYRLTGRQE
jgi:multiple sugar transport system permease protein